MNFTIPDHEYPEFNRLPEDTKNRVRYLLHIMHNIHTSTSTVDACKKIAGAIGKHWNTIYGPWKKFKASQGDWRALIDRRKTPEFWLKDTPVGLPHAFIENWKSRCESFQRACAPAYVELIADLAAWRCGDTNKAIPGYDSPPPNAPGSTHPIGWSYANLITHKPAPHELAAARNGREAAKALLPSVFTTRAHMYPYQEIQFDDMWHDFKVIAHGHKEPARLMEFGAIDVCTGYIFPPGLKPRIRNADTGKMQHLNERDFRIYAVHFLCTVGWSPRGTKFIGERGTAAFRHLADKIHFWTKGKVTTATGGMSGAPARPGDYSEREKGNFKIKALKEGAGRLIHNRLSNLPGQIGMHRNDMPASDHGREKETLALMALEPHLPAEAFSQLQLGHLNFHHAADYVYRAYAKINERTDHNLEGWDALGFVADQFRASRLTDEWLPLTATHSLPVAERLTLNLAFNADPTMLRRHRYSPAQALATAAEPNLKLSADAEADLLLKDCGVTRTVSGGLFTFQDAEIGPEKFRFLATYQDLNGFERRLENGAEAIVVVNPFRPFRAFLFTVNDKRYLGYAKPWLKPNRADQDAVMKQNGLAQAEYKSAMTETTTRLGMKNAKRLTHNATALRSTNKLPTANPDPAFDAAQLLDTPKIDHHTDNTHEYDLDPSILL